MRSITSHHSRTYKRSCGNVLLLTIAVTGFLVLAILIFVLGFTRIVGSHHEQVNAIEAAVLASARSLSQVIVDDANFGLVSLSDAAPKGANTNAKDNFGSPVRGINTVIGTVRLDMFIADQIDDPALRFLADRDYNNLLLLKDSFSKELSRVIQPGQFGVDIDGNKVSPYQSALDVYTSNQIRMTGEQTKLVPGSLKLTLGWIADLPTNTDVPKPYKYSAITQNDQWNGKYLAYRNVSFNNKNFVFAGIGPSTSLVDQKKFRSDSGPLPWLMPTVIKCEADQQFSGTNLTGKEANRTLHAVACAQPGCQEDGSPYAGGFIFIFDDGNIADLSTPLSVFTNSHFATSPADLVQTVSGGDFPTTSPVEFVHPALGNPHPMMDRIFVCALYDWIRRGGTKANIDSVSSFLNTPFSPATASDLHSFQWKSSGTIDYKVLPGAPGVFLPISENQWQAVSGLAFHPTNSSKKFDTYVTDYVYQPGRIKGGQHTGEPLGIDSLKAAVMFNGNTTNNSLFSSRAYAAFPVGPGNGGIRAGYTKNNIAVAVMLHYRKHMHFAVQKETSKQFNF